MEQNITAQSFIVRLYRVDTEDTGKITGLVEALDGSGSQAPFRDADELAGLLNCRPAASRKKGAEGQADRVKKQP
jgi:hypothetical protein